MVRKARGRPKSNKTPRKGATKNAKKDEKKDEDSLSDTHDEVSETEPVINSPSELFLSNDVDGKIICPISDDSLKNKNSMFQAAKALRYVDSKTAKALLKNKQRVSPIKIKIPKESITNKKSTNPSFNKENEQQRSIIPKQNTSRMRTRACYIDSENYFAVQSEKSITSNNTLSKLRNKRLDEKKLQELLKDSKYIPKFHKQKIDLNYKALKYRFIEWIQIMEEGFNVLLYGLGSKRLLINDFYETMLADEPTLVINGFFPSLSIKEILENIIVGLLGLETVPSQSECLDCIKKIMDKHKKDRIYLLIHNIDGEMLRSQKSQEILSCLANIPNVHLLASVDHINAPLIWNNVMRARYNFYWVETTTYLPYEAETSYESSLLIQKSGALALLSMKNVFASLTPNAKQIFIVLLKYQLENSGNNYSGMTFKDLHHASREGFLVSSDQALRAQLCEFIDHKLVKTKRNLDGAECLLIPLDNSLLRQFLDQYNETS